MGKQYQAAIEQKVLELGGGRDLRAFINPDGVEPAYLQHLLTTLRQLDVAIVEERSQANFVFDGHAEPTFADGTVTSYFRDGTIHFEGRLLQLV